MISGRKGWETSDLTEKCRGRMYKSLRSGIFEQSLTWAVFLNIIELIFFFLILGKSTLWMVNIYLGTETSTCSITFLAFFFFNYVLEQDSWPVCSDVFTIENCAEIAYYPSRQVSIILCLLIEYKKLWVWPGCPLIHLMSLNDILF